MKFTDFKVGQTVTYDEQYAATVIEVCSNCVHIRVHYSGEHKWVYDLDMIF